MIAIETLNHTQPNRLRHLHVGAVPYTWNGKYSQHHSKTGAAFAVRDFNSNHCIKPVVLKPIHRTLGQ